MHRPLLSYGLLSAEGCCLFGMIFLFCLYHRTLSNNIIALPPIVPAAPARGVMINSQANIAS